MIWEQRLTTEPGGPTSIFRIVTRRQVHPPTFVAQHYRAFAATTGCSAPALRFGTVALAAGTACGFSLGIEEQVLTFRTKRLVVLRAAYMPDAARAVSCHPPS